MTTMLSSLALAVTLGLTTVPTLAAAQAADAAATSRSDEMSRTEEQLHIERSVLAALEALTRDDVTAWPALFAEDGTQEFPYAPEGSPRIVEGREAIAAYLADYPEVFDLTRIGEPVWHHDGNTAIVEFDVEGTAVQTGNPYNQRYINVIYHEGGLITRFVDYWNPLVVQEAVGGMYQ